MNRNAVPHGPGPRSSLPAEWRGIGLREILRHPLPFQRHSLLNRVIARSVVLAFRHKVLAIHGLHRVAVENDPFILVLNHNQWQEAVILPTLLIFHRGGKLIHFISDWNFQLIPVARTILRRSEVITIVAKPARPAFLNVFRRFFETGTSAWTRAREKVLAGASVGVFPEGTINRDPERLLPGNPRAAQVSLQAGVPILPAGITFPRLPPGRRIPNGEPMEVTIGEPMVPPAPARPGHPSLEEVRAWHHEVMGRISRLCGKRWDPPPARRER